MVNLILLYNERMKVGLVFIDYLRWHYTKALVELCRIYKNITVFLYGFFSIGVLLRSYFAPWRRLGEDYPSNLLDIAGILSVLVVNTLMRLFGLVMRTVIIVFGLLIVCLFIILFPFLLLLWLLLPLIVLTLFILGIFLLIVA